MQNPRQGSTLPPLNIFESHSEHPQTIRKYAHTKNRITMWWMIRLKCIIWGWFSLNELILVHQFSSHLLTQLHQLLSLKMNVRHASVNPSRMPATFQDHGIEVFGINSVHCTFTMYNVNELTSVIFWKVATAPWGHSFNMIDNENPTKFPIMQHNMYLG